jgi:hypothetical protein
LILQMQFTFNVIAKKTLEQGGRLSTPLSIRQSRR